MAAADKKTRQQLRTPAMNPVALPMVARTTQPRLSSQQAMEGKAATRPCRPRSDPGPMPPPVRRATVVQPPASSTKASPVRLCDDAEAGPARRRQPPCPTAAATRGIFAGSNQQGSRALACGRRTPARGSRTPARGRRAPAVAAARRSRSPRARRWPPQRSLVAAAASARGRRAPAGGRRALRPWPPRARPWPPRARQTLDDLSVHMYT
nr:uncharacterized protein LOC127316082 [Lolium perenne]